MKYACLTAFASLRGILLFAVLISLPASCGPTPEERAAAEGRSPSPSPVVESKLKTSDLPMSEITSLIAVVRRVPAQFIVAVDLLEDVYKLKSVVAKPNSTPRQTARAELDLSNKRAELIAAAKMLGQFSRSGEALKAAIGETPRMPHEVKAWAAASIEYMAAHSIALVSMEELSEANSNLFPSLFTYNGQGVTVNVSSIRAIEVLKEKCLIHGEEMSALGKALEGRYSEMMAAIDALPR